MKRPPRNTWLVLCAALWGCSAAVDFDRSKIERPDGSDEDGGMDAAVDGSRSEGGTDARVDAPDQPDAEGGSEGCTGDAECGANELCCDNRCVPATAEGGCEACAQACEGNANSCVERVCGCGAGPACSGATPFCEGTGGAARCVECLGDTDCEANANGTQCVNGTCSECDDSDGNSGCDGDTPICVGTSCMGCSASRPCTGGMTCLPDGRCVGCALGTNQGCDPDGTSPLCAQVAGQLQCTRCVSDASCQGNPNGGQCVAAGSCEQCDRTQNNAGCVAASTTPICGQNNRCRACNPTGDCTGATPYCSPAGTPTAGRCVACLSGAQCSGATPICDAATGTCRGCTTDAECPDGAPACVAGACTLCRSGGPNACPVATPHCSPANMCVRCLTTGHCEDGNACTTDACTAAFVCTNTPVAVSDDVGCTVDACDPVAGVTHTPDNTMCTQDSNLCTIPATCNPATGNPTTGCTAQTPVVCPQDAFSCTAPSTCNPATGSCSAQMPIDEECPDDPTTCRPGICAGADGAPGTGCALGPPSCVAPLVCNGAGSCTAPPPPPPPPPAD